MMTLIFLFTFYKHRQDIGQQKYANFVEKRINTNEQYLGQNKEVSIEDMEKCKEVDKTQSG